MSQEQPPNPLYRYVSDIERVEEVVEKNVLSFARPSSFNDPFDCKVVFSCEGASLEAVRKYVCRIFKDGPPDLNDLEITSTTVEGFLKDKWPRLSEFLEEYTQEYRERVQILSENYYVCCFSELPKDILMWGHYANKHRGFCLQFDTHASGFEWYKVKYRKEFPLFDDVENLLEEGPSAASQLIKVLLCSKFEHWGYEEEWRVIKEWARKPPSEDNHIPIQIPQTCLTGVIFGCNCPDEQIEWVKTFVRESGKQIKLYKAEKSTTSYAVEIREMGS